MRKPELAAAIADKADLTKDQANRVLNAVLDEITNALNRKDSAYGFATMNAKNKQLAFMQGIQNEDIQIQGNPALVMWFQGLTKYLKPRKKKPEAA